MPLTDQQKLAVEGSASCCANCKHWTRIGHADPEKAASCGTCTQMPVFSEGLPPVVTLDRAVCSSWEKGKTE